MTTARTIREAWADLERRTKELIAHEDACGRCFRATRDAIKSRTPTPRARMAHLATGKPRCISGLVAWRRWCRARDVFTATTRLRSRYGVQPIAPRVEPELPPMPAPPEVPTDLEQLERELEATKLKFARRRWWRTRCK